MYLKHNINKYSLSSKIFKQDLSRTMIHTQAPAWKVV